MPRKQFIADLQALLSNLDTPGISQVKAGADDGEVVITIAPADQSSTFNICSQVLELSSYPSSHSYLIYADDDAPDFVGEALYRLPIMDGKDLSTLLSVLSHAFHGTNNDGDVVMIDSQLDDEASDEDYGFDDDFDSDDHFDEQKRPSTSHSLHLGFQPRSVLTPEMCGRIRNDLRTAKNAGFKVGHYGSLMEGGNSYVTMSIRVSKLGISDQALQAWQLTGQHYLILIIHYPNGYRTLDDLEKWSRLEDTQNIHFRIGCSHAYKPTAKEITKSATKTSLQLEAEESQEMGEETGFRDTFISNALNQLFNHRFPTILRYRNSRNLTWTAAENLYNDSQGSINAAKEVAQDTSGQPHRESPTRPFPRIVTSDHFTSSPSSQKSLPLLAMEFLLRHFVRCTEFCLVCHTKLPQDLEAIKPYVCDKPLCLYQYMSLGFGPRIEHEILSQPQVVDLLISFCYASVAQGGLSKTTDFPNGLNLMLPNFKVKAPLEKPSKQKTATQDSFGTLAKFSATTCEMIFDKDCVCPLKVGDWVCMRLIGVDELLHCRVKETIYYPTVRLSSPIHCPELTVDLPPTKTNSFIKIIPKKSALESALSKEGWQDVCFNVYDQNFDDLIEPEKNSAIQRMIELTPRVMEIREYLAQRKDRTLTSWIDKMPPAAMGILRWIVASNRACIMQTGMTSGSTKQGNLDDMVYGMKDWLQFRFAMGAPDKERRFVQAVNDTGSRLSLKYPTLFAYHGSPLHNWHTIIRQGLHFEKITSGRAYGNGVYHSPDANTSLSYSQFYDRTRQPGYTDVIPGNVWRNSDLRITHAMAVNEIVNAPAEFTSQNPHLVVQHLDWIQTRFLFAYCISKEVKVPEVTQSADPFEQDPQRTPRGPDGKSLVIPRAVVPTAGRVGHISKPIVADVSKAFRSKMRRAKKTDDISARRNTGDDDSAYESAATDQEDLDILQDEASMIIDQPQGDNKKSFGSNLKAVGQAIFGSRGSTKTDFVPGQLNYTSLPIMLPPSWATTSASQRLLKEFQVLVKVQNTTPLHELGWYTDPERVENMYQWIVELHSFDQDLPLTKQLKQQGMKSVVCEVQFRSDFPMSPPFIRVIRPRFLPFAQGGGGHVTAGGSLCMELLTNTGWSPASSIESVLMQVHLALSSTDPQPAQLESRRTGDYGIHEAVEAYMRVCNQHGWKYPANFRELAMGGTPAR